MTQLMRLLDRNKKRRREPDDECPEEDLRNGYRVCVHSVRFSVGHKLDPRYSQNTSAVVSAVSDDVGDRVRTRGVGEVHDRGSTAMWWYMT